MPKPKKLSDIIRDIFGTDFRDELNFDFDKQTTPEEFMGNSDYTKTEEAGEEEDGTNFTKTTYTSKDGKRKFTRKVINAVPSKGNSDIHRENRIYTLEQDLKIAIEKEEFEIAAQIRDEISKLKKGK